MHDNEIATVHQRIDVGVLGVFVRGKFGVSCAIGPEAALAMVAPELRENLALTDEAIEALVAERTQAKKQRNFARADEIRNQLAAKGVILEDSKDGVRWKRK